VLLHGWGMTPAVFDALADALRSSYVVHAMALPGYCAAPSAFPYSIEKLAESIAARAPERCCVAGWSLGAQVALEWARSQPRQVEALALLAATPSFVQRAGWSHAVEPAVFENFAENLERDRDATLARFASLQAHGDAAMKATATRLRACVGRPAEIETDTLRQGLGVLLDADLRASLRAVGQETLVVHGESDRLVPLAAGEYLAREMPHARLSTIPGASHAPFVSRPDAVAAALKDFLR
jgi:pimeloyl-[acyl-carrier protein] methyl ester esterase